MTDDLLKAPERRAIEALLAKLDATEGEPPSYVRLLGFLAGVVLTPGLFMPSQWLQPLLDANGIIFEDFADANGFMSALMPLYNRVNDLRLRDRNLCPYLLDDPEALVAQQSEAADWVRGLHAALALNPEIWAPSPKGARQVPPELQREMGSTIPFLWAVAEPRLIPKIIPDPVPFQKSFLSTVPDWKDDMFSETWTEELMDVFELSCLGRLNVFMDVLQRYAKAYGEGAPGPFASQQSFAPQQPVVRGDKVGRNDPCPCGSGKKFKKCCAA
jgi:yecA family protein